MIIKRNVIDRLACIIWMIALLGGRSVHAAPISGYIRDLPPESANDRKLRHAKVAERRRGDVVLIAHRGASTLARENTLAAYAAAMDYGADGCEVDLRRTTDGILVLFHDDMLDRLTDGFGRVEDLSYPELLALHPQGISGDELRNRPPTFAALLTLARQRAMLLILDTKDTGFEDQIAQMLDEADAWDHVVGINAETAPKLRTNPRLQPLSGKCGIYEDRSDIDPDAVKKALARPGQILMLEDPRLAVKQLHRKSLQFVPLPEEVFVKWSVTGNPHPSTTSPNFISADYLRTLSKRINPNSAKDLLSLLSRDGNANGNRERILERAWASERLGSLGKNPAIITALETLAEHPGLHADWLFCGLDAYTAARALGQLQAIDSAPLLIETFRKANPELVKFRNPEWTNSPVSWVDWRKMCFIPVFGELRDAASKRFLLEYVTKSEAEVREWSIPQFPEATKALFRCTLSRSELLSLLHSTNSNVRGTAILECLDHADRDRIQALRETAPWALELPRARLN